MKFYLKIYILIPEKRKEKAKKDEYFGYRHDLVAITGEDKVLVEMNNNNSGEIRDRNLSYAFRT